MSPDHLLAIDVGTRSVRAVVFDRAGQMLARTQTLLTPAFKAPLPGWAELDALGYRQAVVQSCMALRDGSTVTPDCIAGLSLTTQRGTVVCAAEDGTPLRPAIVWPDQRLCSAPPPLGPLWATLFGAAGAGDLLRHLQRQAEANWLAQHEAALWQRCERFVLLSGWLTKRLVGDWVDATACQFGYLPFGYRRQRWARRWDWHWRALALRPALLPRLVAPAATLGGLTAAAAAALGLQPGLPMIAAAADKACEVLGCGALETHTAHLSFGTAATINTTQPRYVEVQRLLPAYPAALPGSFNTELHIQSGFWLVNWFKQQFAYPELARAEQRGVAAETLFDELIAAVPAGSLGLVLQPYWSPGLREPGPEAKRLAYGLRAGRERIEQRVGHPLTRLLVSGGGAQSDGAMQITADVFNLPATRTAVADASAPGAAMLCAAGLGWYADVPATVAGMARDGRTFTPQPAAVTTYDALYREVYKPLYGRLYGRLRPLYRRIRAITGHPPA